MSDKKVFLYCSKCLLFFEVTPDCSLVCIVCGNHLELTDCTKYYTEDWEAFSPFTDDSLPEKTSQIENIMGKLRLIEQSPLGAPVNFEDFNESSQNQDVVSDPGCSDEVCPGTKKKEVMNRKNKKDVST